MVERTGDQSSAPYPWEVIDHRTRASENRELETREREEHANLAYLPPTNLPDPLPEPGYVYRWVRTSILGDADNRNVSMRMREGWEPVLAEDHPELMIASDRGSTFEGNIEVGGLVLCKTLAENMAKRDRYYSQMAQRQMQSVDQNFMRENDPRMPLLRTEHTSHTTFGTGSPISREPR